VSAPLGGRAVPGVDPYALRDACDADRHALRSALAVLEREEGETPR